MSSSHGEEACIKWLRYFSSNRKIDLPCMICGTHQFVWCVPFLYVCNLNVSCNLYVCD